MPTDTSFVPSVHGLRFTNEWPASSIVARRGLCGGMVFTALDVFVAGLPPLLDVEPPPPGSPLFNYIVRRLLASWDMPCGVVRYYRGMALGVAQDEWPLIKESLDAGRPCPLGLVTVRSWNPLRLGQNHQVLAYGYDGEAVRVYDPNTSVAGADDVRIKLDLSGHNVNVGGPIRGFFRVRYVPADPSGLYRRRRP